MVIFCTVPTFAPRNRTGLYRSRPRASAKRTVTSPPPKKPYRMMRYPAMNTASAGTIQIHGDHFPKCTFASGVGLRRRSTSCWSYSLTARWRAVQDERPFCYRPFSPLNTRKYLALAALAVWVLILYATHLGGWSPYSYGWAIFQRPSARLLGRVVNPDALQMVPAMRLLYDGTTPPKWEEVTNLRLPLHPFIVATIASFTRSYLLANDIVNIGGLLLLLVVALNLAERRQLERLPVRRGPLT